MIRASAAAGTFAPRALSYSHDDDGVGDARAQHADVAAWSGERALTNDRVQRNPVGAIDALARRYGELYTFPSLQGPSVVASNPADIRAIFAADPDTFVPFGVDAMAPVLGRGSVLLQHGATHRRARKLMQPPFHGARMRAYGESIANIAHAHLVHIPPSTKIDIEEVFRGISLDVILQTIFGVAEKDDNRARDAVLGTMSSLHPLLLIFSFLRREGFGPWRRLQRLLADTHALLREQTAARRAPPGGTDICSLLVAARDEAGEPMDEQEIVEQLFTMVVAGHETTATALAWAVDELWRQPTRLQLVREELQPLDGDPERLAAHPHLDAICAETLRLHPLVPLITRRLRVPFTVGGYDLPAGIGVAACLAVAHRRAETFDNPHAFVPERFSLAGKPHSPHDYFPFGGGARRCLGAAFAFYEMEIVLGTLICNGTPELISKHPARAGTRSATIGPRGGVPAVYRR